MAKLKLTGKDIRNIGFEEGPSVGLAMEVMNRHYKFHSSEDALEVLKNVLANPLGFAVDEVLGKVAHKLITHENSSPKEIPMREQGVDYCVFGAEQIEEGAWQQMKTAVRLPIAVGGALMPDAHQGYGLPIGGVLATENAVIPYGVGVDIGCRMCLSVFPVNEKYIHGKEGQLENMLLDNTRFGRATFKSPKDHEVIERSEFKEINMLKQLKDKAWSQLGSSGSGNHFVEFGVVQLEESNHFHVEAGNYVAVLSHSGSRNLGATIAKHFTSVAKEKCRLPQHSGHLAWLNLDSEEGQEYWSAMNLAGDYASACHHQIHERLTKAFGAEVMIRVENHHNFAWKEMWDGKEVIIHRKGATPAHAGTLGIIPGSMTAPGFIVIGKGNTASLNSAAHGAGRAMSRSKAKESISGKMFRDELKRAGVRLIGAGLDEAPMAYKNIHTVMKHQTNLVDVAGVFYPRIVRMCGDDSPAED
ncbi:MAG: RtcB family protein [Flavobacteriales bacterium]|nr:RtcB family protein [Flavobacteriales bacterium]